ncbi:MAG: hypothetical protein Q9173_006714 [Seirophora scorigena]
MGKKKRTHAQYADDHDDPASHRLGAHDMSVGSGPLHVHDQRRTNLERLSNHTRAANDADGDSWTVVGRGGKKLKTNNYPALVYSDLHKQSSCIRIGDLQNLVLFCIANGTTPQYISVRHHFGVKKVVVLFVPGLERGMFDGNVSIDSSEDVQQGLELGKGADRPTEKMISDNSVPRSVAVQQENGASHTPASPDEFSPVRLAADNLPNPLKPLAACFEHLWPVKAQGDDKYAKVYSPLHAMLNSQIPKLQEQKDAERVRKGAKPVANSQWQNKRTPVKDFILSKDELQDHDYVLHPVYFDSESQAAAELKRRADAKQTSSSGWIDANIVDLGAGEVPDQEVEQGSLTAGRTVFAMDCEMCKVEGDDAALTRISLVGWDGEVVVDELVKPDKPIVDYLTPFSGITAEKLDPVTTTLADVQKRLLDILTPRTILVGHSLDSDLAALKLTHPFIIDTSVLYQHPRGPPLKSSLKWLAQKYLHREIQKGHGSLGHDSVEDSRACLDLVKMKCEKGPEWGNSATSGETIFKRLSRTPRAGSSLAADGGQGKTGAIIDHGAPEKNFGQMATFSIGCNTDADVVDGIKRAVLGDPDGAMIPGGGVDFTWARMRELEACRRWSNNHRYDIIQMEDSSTTEPSPSELAATVASTVSHIRNVHASLPPCTLFVVYSGTGDPRELARLQQMQRTFKQEYKVKNWNQLSVRWTDTEEQAMKQACRKARQGLGFVTIT